ncbi:RagB/SusD family nutrient uptake outer membrane protein [Sphingobacterium thalpophilum]|uniref:RagB/SusD family nutrient uptake outer membrane protein n=1 Tax=Sphingobacterium thalpophilum TaxID=259 RepID=A0ACD5BYN2_9SPHI
MKKLIKIAAIILATLVMSCTKDFLEKKPDKALVVPQTLDDLQALLDDTYTMNQRYPATGEVASDNYYLNDQNYNAVAGLVTKNAYIWKKNVFDDGDRNDWSLCYAVVFYSNVVLEALNKITPTIQEKEKWETIKGTALFYRALAFYNLSQLFMKPYDNENAGEELGIVLRLTPDINEPSQRSSMKDTYEAILNDLHVALEILPKTVLAKTRPSVTACKALLARVYLSMEKYQEAANMADESLKDYDKLIDYNTISKTSIRPFSLFNDEVIFHYTLFGQPISLARIEPTLYDQYEENDLRKVLYFREAPGTDLYSFKGSYQGGSTMFGGLATDELYLIRAECAARTGNIESALNDLNTLLQKRWSKVVKYNPLSESNRDVVLAKVLAERRKSLVFRGLRWSDLRRLNKDPRFKTVISRNLNGEIFQLMPESSSYIFQIPQKVINNNGMMQNE